MPLENLQKFHLERKRKSPKVRFIATYSNWLIKSDEKYTNFCIKISEVAEKIQEFGKVKKRNFAYRRKSGMPASYADSIPILTIL